MAKYPGLRTDYVKAGLFFPEEVTVEPRTMIHRLQAYLVQEKGLKLLTYQQVIHCSVQNGKAEVLTSFGNKLLAHNVIICNGSEFKTLYPELFAQSDMEVTKLQMLQTVPQPSDYILLDQY